MHSFKKGDLVVLKSGGPVMVVEDVHLASNIETQWFSGKKLERGFFDPATLLPAPEEKKSK